MGKSKELATLTDQGFETSKPIKVGKEGITNAYGDAYGYVADFQADTGNQTYISIAEPNAPSTGDNGLILGEDTGGSYFYQRQSKPMYFGTNNLTRMTIDASGRVTMPYQPSWSLQPNHVNTSYAGGTDTILPFANTNTHRTFINGVSVNNGRVTVPVSGRYYVYASFRQEGVAAAYQLSFYLNGAQNARGGIWYSSQIYENINISRVLSLDANDYIEVKMYTDTTFNVNGYNDNLTFFEGYLLG